MIDDHRSKENRNPLVIRPFFTSLPFEVLDFITSEGNLEVLTAWRTASHVQRVSSPTKLPTTFPPA